MITFFKFCPIAIFILSTGCRLTEKSVTGIWLSGHDTLFVNQDYTFRLTARKDSYVKKDSTMVFDTSIVYSTGKWSVSKKTLNLTFKGDKKEFFGNCDALWLWGWRSFFKRNTLIRPRYCYEPSNRFTWFTKLK